MQIILTNRAIGDIERAKKWYKKQQENLGNKFAEFLSRAQLTFHKQPKLQPSKSNTSA